MRFYPGDPDHQPLGHVGRVPVFAATIFAVLYVVGLVVKVFIQALGGNWTHLAFSSEQFFGHGWLWQPLTCTFINEPNFFFPLAVIFTYQFGVEYERFFGRQTYLTLNALILASITMVLGGWYLVGVPGFFYSMTTVSIGLIVAYATLYPNLEYLGWVPFKFIAFVCIFIDSLSYLQNRDWPGLSVMLAICAVSFGYTRYKKLGGAVELPAFAHKLNPFRRRPRFRVLPSPEGSSFRASPDRSGPIESVDAILDKIAQKGFASLTQTERDQLEKAREILNKKRS